jgi:hypothetical protein
LPVRADASTIFVATVVITVDVRADASTILVATVVITVDEPFHHSLLKASARIVWEAPRTITHLPSEPQDEEGNPILTDGLSNLFPGWSELREEMARNVEKMGLTRPVGGKLN